jgi:hypothetical protein
MADFDEMKEIFAKKAKAGDGAFAIAYAILDLSDSQEATSKALQRLGNGNASTDVGAIEGLSMQIVKAAENIAESITYAASNIGNSIDGHA